MGLPSVVPSAETAKSEAERQEREALADMFSPSSPHDHHERIESKALSGSDTPNTKDDDGPQQEFVEDGKMEDDKGI